MSERQNKMRKHNCDKGSSRTGKSTVISSCCFDSIREYSPVLVVTPTNTMVDSILAKIDSLARRANLELPTGFVIRYGNTTELNYSFPYLNSYTLDFLMLWLEDGRKL